MLTNLLTGPNQQPKIPICSTFRENFPLFKRTVLRNKIVNYSSKSSRTKQINTYLVYKFGVCLFDLAFEKGQYDLMLNRPTIKYMSLQTIIVYIQSLKISL